LQQDFDQVDDAGVLVADQQRTGAERDTRFAEGLEVHGVSCKLAGMIEPLEPPVCAILKVLPGFMPLA
jgi:hypothetical protein